MANRSRHRFTNIMVFYFVFVCLTFSASYANEFDKPCVARTSSNSVDCVCNATYCDEVTRADPQPGQFTAYYSSKSGFRFDKIKGTLSKPNYGDATNCISTLDLDPKFQYQTIEGFGGGVTDSAAGLWVNLTDPQLKKYLIDSYFSSTGIEYNMLRLPIGATDFSPRVYSYQDFPEDDASLSNFSLAYEDTMYKIPMIKEALKAATAPIEIVGTAWSPPLWMKSKHEISGVTLVKKKYYEALAKYHFKFLEEYKANGIDIWGLTTINEPMSGVMSLGHNYRVTWTTEGLGKWIAENLGPMIRNSSFKDVKIIVGDDQRMFVPMLYNLVIRETPEAEKYIDGVGVHYYFDDITPPDMLTVPMKDHPDKFVLYTETSVGLENNMFTQCDGSWGKAEKYVLNILEDLNYNVTGFIDWNMCLNPEGGPSWLGASLDAPIFIDLEKNEFTKRPLFFAMGHFSKFIPRGSRRISVRENFVCGAHIENVAFLTPNGTIVAVLYNKDEEERTVQLKLGYEAVEVVVAPKSVVTVEFCNNDY